MAPRPPSPPLSPYTTLFRSSPLPEVPQARPPTKMLYLFLQTIVPTVPASFLTFGTTPLYHFYEHVPRLWGEGEERRSEEHTSELQSRSELVCRLLHEKKKTR